MSFESQSSRSKISTDSLERIAHITNNRQIKLSVYNFNFTPLMDDHVITYERPLRGYRVDMGRLRQETLKPSPQIPVHQSEQLPEQAKIDAVLKGKVDTSMPDPKKFFFEPLQLLRKDRDMVKMQDDTLGMGTANIKTVATQGKRELATVHTVCAPKTGAIKLAGVTYELDYPLVYDDRKQEKEKKPAGDDSGQPCIISWKNIRTLIDTICCGSGSHTLRNRDKEFLDETEETQKGHSIWLQTMVGGLLMFEIPEVPTLNNIIQKFVAANINYNTDDTSDEVTSNIVAQRDKDSSQHSNHYPSVYSANTLKKIENLPQHTRSSVTTTRPLVEAPTDLNNHRSVIDNSKQHGKAVYEIWYNSENSNNEISNFHQVLLKAKNMNQSYTNKLNVSDVATQIQNPQH